LDLAAKSGRSFSALALSLTKSISPANPVNHSVATALHRIQTRCQQLFTATIYWSGAPVDESSVRALLPHPEWIPESVWRYARAMNGLDIEWDRRNGEGKIIGSGKIGLSKIEDIYAETDWAHDADLEDPAFARMRAFQPVDYYDEVSWAGLFHDEAQDPGLYMFISAEGMVPYPLHVDVEGYIALLEHTLGYGNWPWAILALLPDDGINPVYQYNLNYNATFRQRMQVLVPEFSYEAFVACYDRVRLRNYSPSL
jgi:hypothetical protein